MPRNFLAPYKFNVAGSRGCSFLDFLLKNKGNYYLNQEDQTALILSEIDIRNNRAYGCIQYGRYGTESPVININTQQITKVIEENESPLYSYFYLIEYNEARSSGYMILQRIGNIGVRTAFSKALEDWGLKIRIEPIVIGLKELLNNPIMEFRIRIPKKPKDIDSRLDKLKIVNEEDMYVEISIKSKRNKFIKLVESLKRALSNSDLSDIGYIYDKEEQIDIVVKVGKSQRTVNITQGRVRTWIEVKNVDDIENEAEQLLTYIKEEAG